MSNGVLPEAVIAENIGIVQIAISQPIYLDSLAVIDRLIRLPCTCFFFIPLKQNN